MSKDRNAAVSLLIESYILILEMVEKGLNDYANQTDFGWQPESMQAMRHINEAQTSLRKCVRTENEDFEL